MYRYVASATVGDAASEDALYDFVAARQPNSDRRKSRQTGLVGSAWRIAIRGGSLCELAGDEALLIGRAGARSARLHSR
jgi:hypothetical protein